MQQDDVAAEQLAENPPRDRLGPVGPHVPRVDRPITDDQVMSRPIRRRYAARGAKRKPQPTRTLAKHFVVSVECSFQVLLKGNAVIRQAATVRKQMRADFMFVRNFARQRRVLEHLRPDQEKRRLDSRAA
jgi:hypothetical protein